MTDATLIWRSDAAAEAGFDFRHPLDASNGCRMTPLSRMAGLGDVAVNHVTIAPGEQGFPHHVHQNEEEWVYVLSGSAVVRLGEEEHSLGPGDFVAFPSGGDAHSIRNPGTEVLACLMGGQILETKVVDMPDLGKRAVWTGKGLSVAPLDAFEAVQPPGGEK